MAVATLGLRGTGTFSADERPQNWRQGILLIFPNGDAPLTALLSKTSEEPTDDPQINWFEKTLPIQRGTILGASILVLNVQPASPTTVAAAAGTTTSEVALALQPDGGAANDVTWLAPGYIVINERTEESYIVDKVDTLNGFAVVRRNIGAKFTPAGNLPSIVGNVVGTGDSITVTGYAAQEGAPVGSPVSFSPIRHFNFTEIFRTPLSITRTARRTRLRYDKTGPYMEAKREALQIHSLLLERSLFLGEREEITGGLTQAQLPILGGVNGLSSGNPARTLRGMLNWMPAVSTSNAAASIHWDIGTAFGGALAEPTFDAWCEEVFRYGSSEKVCWAGSTALNVLNQLAKNKLTITAVPSDRTYGMQFNRYTTPFGDLLVKQHPLLSHNPTYRKDLWVMDLAHIRTRPLDDTTFLRNRQNPGDDASVDEFLTELSVEVRFSGATPTNAGGLPAIAGPAAHGRLKGLAQIA
jgi:hypothetical protein